MIQAVLKREWIQRYILESHGKEMEGAALEEMLICTIGIISIACFCQWMDGTLQYGNKGLWSSVRSFHMLFESTSTSHPL